MRPTPIHLAVAAGLGAILAWGVRDPRALLEPGPLAPGHAKIAQDCLACHRLGRGVPAQRCVRCHRRETIGLVTSEGAPITRAGGTLVGSFHVAIRERECVACHTDHEGAAGGRSGRRFSHDMLEPAARDSCGACHRAPADALHRGVTSGCATCHSGERWTPATFAHARWFVLEGDHQAPCATCHPGGAFQRYTCYGCHEHDPARIRGKHLEEGIRAFEDCVRCHRSGSEHEGGEGGRGGRGNGEHEGGRGGDQRGREGDDD